MALIALGYRTLSITPSAVGPVKAMMLDLDAGKAWSVLRPLMDGAAGSVRIRDHLEAFATAEGLQI